MNGKWKRKGRGEDTVRIRVPKEGEAVRKLPDPKSPSKEEWETHNLMGHIPYRSWRQVCIKAQGKDWDHAKDKGKERSLPKYRSDYCFPGDEFGHKWTVLVGEEAQSKSWMASAVPSK